MPIVLVFLLLVSCSRKEGFKEITIKHYAYCSVLEFTEECSEYKAKIANHQPSKDDLDLLLRACDEKIKQGCSLVAFYYEKKGEIENAKKFSMAGCKLGSVNACITGWHLLQSVSEKYEYSKLGCEHGDDKSCTNEVVELIQMNREEEAMTLALSLCRKNRGIDCYNTACLYSRKNQIDEAKKYIFRAIELNYMKLEYFENDPDLENLRNSPQGKELEGVLKNSKL